MDDLAVELALVGAMAIEIDDEVALGQHFFDVRDVVHRRVGLEALHVRGGERLLVAPLQFDALFFAVALA